jgi:hypothetical protein
MLSDDSLTLRHRGPPSMALLPRNEGHRGRGQAIPGLADACQCLGPSRCCAALFSRPAMRWPNGLIFADSVLGDSTIGEHPVQ